MSTVAETLCSARESRSLTIQQVADLTKIKTEHVRDLESGNYQSFAAPVYIRGFVRNYAEVLKLDVSKVMETLDEELSQTKEFRAPPSLTGERRGTVDFVMLHLSRLNWWIMAPIAGLVLVVAASFWAVQAWRTYQARDPLAGLKPALYEPKQKNPGEVLPLPPAPKK